MVNNNDVPDILYHYTSQEGLIGIIENGEIWATDILYLNDEKEFKLAFELAQDFLRKKIATASQEASALKVILGIITQIAEYQRNVYVSSFSVEGNLLSQWRGYCPQGLGYSIGFRRSDLEKLAQEQEFRLEQCFYEPSKHDNLVKHWIESLPLEHFFDSLQDDIQFQALYDSILGLLLLAPKLKDRTFFEEQEWRLVGSPALVKPGSGDNGESGQKFQFKFRASENGLVPYYRFNLKKADGRIHPARIIVGPNGHPDQNLAKKPVHQLLSIFGIDNGCSVELSQIPYRI